MTWTFPSSVEWSGVRRKVLGRALRASGTLLIGAGSALLFCGAQLHVLSTRLNPK